MKFLPILTLLISGACASASMAQTAAPAKPDTKKNPPATSSKPRGKPAAKPVAPPPPPPLPDATEEQLAATERAYLGTYDCEFKQSIAITRNIKQGYLDVLWQKSVFTMKPVLSSTGALRLEDVTGRTLMIQIANKSMLMDTKLGQRLVDDCLHPEQRAAIEAARAARAAAAASGVSHDSGTGLGIAPGSTAASAPAKP
jgi:type IV secretory pathway VirB10-like protein